jgi:hypothetical protein
VCDIRICVILWTGWSYDRDDFLLKDLLMTKDLRTAVPTADWFISSGCIDSIRSRTIQYVGLIYTKRTAGYQVSTISTLLYEYIQQHVNQLTFFL